MKEISNRMLAGLAAFAIAISLAIPTLVFAVTDTGTAAYTLTEVTEVNFTTASIDWGAGSVDSGEASATLDSDAGTVTTGSWSTNSGNLVLEVPQPFKGFFARVFAQRRFGCLELPI